MKESAGDYQLVFLGRPRKLLGKTLVTQGLLKMCSGNKVQAQTLYRKSPKVIFQSTSKASVQRMLNNVWRCGWHAKIVRSGRCVFSTEQQKVDSGSLERGANQAPPLVSKAAANAVAMRLRARRIFSVDKDVSIALPTDWLELGNLNAGAVIQAGCQSRQVFLIAIRQYKETFGRDFPLRDYALATCQAALGWVAAAELSTPPKLVNSGGYYRAEMEGCIGDTRVKYQITIHEAAGLFYAVYAWSTLEGYAQSNRELKAIAASFTPQVPARHVEKARA